jgi:quercetin dioxygenase-like cupin family protein
MDWPPRRVVTGHDEHGTSTVVFDGTPPIVEEIAQGKARLAEIWSTAATPVPLGPAEAEPTETPIVVPPKPNGHVIRYFEMDPGWRSPMHRTESLDYGIVLRGEVHMAVDETEVVLRPGDVVVQCGTDHAWENRGSEKAMMIFVLVDGVFTGELRTLIGEKAEHLMVEPAKE